MAANGTAPGTDDVTADRKANSELYRSNIYSATCSKTDWMAQIDNETKEVVSAICAITMSQLHLEMWCAIQQQINSVVSYL